MIKNRNDDSKHEIRQADKMFAIDNAKKIEVCIVN